MATFSTDRKYVSFRDEYNWYIFGIKRVYFNCSHVGYIKQYYTSLLCIINMILEPRILGYRDFMTFLINPDRTLKFQNFGPYQIE